mgnify:CR=1 FL=1
MKDSPNEMEAISQLGDTWNVSEDQLCSISAFDKIWKSCKRDDFENGNTSEQGWNPNGQTQWTDDFYPDDIKNILINDEI